MARLRLLIVFASIFCFSPAHSAATGGSTGSVDEILIAVPLDRSADVVSIASKDVRCYQRLPDHLLIGTSRRTLDGLRAAGIPVTLVDDRAWTTGYALVSPAPRRAVRDDFLPPGVSVVLEGTDYRFIKAAKETFGVLRGRGHACTEISPVLVPLPKPPASLPDHLFKRKTDAISAILDSVSDTSLRDYIQGLQNFQTRHWSQPTRDTVSKWVQAHFVAAGVGDVVLEGFAFQSTWQQNVIATIPGTVHPDTEIVIGGHMDSQSSPTTNAPGADDNGSGAAATLEIARVLKATNYQPKYTLRFVGFAAEEAGLVGSQIHVSTALLNGRAIKVMLNFDMIANRNQAQADRDYYVVWYVGSESFARLDSAMARLYTSLNPILTTSYRSQSDSYRFWQGGYDAVFCIERDFSPYYHTPNDLLQYLDLPYSSEIVKAGLAMVLTLDDNLTGVAEGPAGIPSMTRLLQNYPNPFNPSTDIRYELSSPGYVELALYDILGRRIADLDKGYKSAGTYSVRWDGGEQATGMYFCRLTVRETWDSPASMMHTQKLVLLR